MNSLTDLILSTESPIDLVESIYSFLIAFVLGGSVAITYSLTTKTIFSQKKDFLLTLVLITVILTGIMHIVGSNLARSLGLIGSLSIIRYRTAIKNPRDIIFIFLVLAIGMAVGSRMYLLAFIMTFFSIIIIVLFSKFSVSLGKRNQYVISVICSADINCGQAIDNTLSDKTLYHKLINIELISQTQSIKRFYNFSLKKSVSRENLLESFKKIDDSVSVQIVNLFSGAES